MKAFRLIVLIAGLSCGGQLQATDQVVTLVGDPWPPYLLGELGGQATGGIGIELLQAIFERLEGVRLSTPMVPWNRALREVEQGSKDGIGILIKTAQREQYLAYTDEVFRSYNRIWYAADKFPSDFQWQQYADLEGYVIGIIRGHNYGEPLDSMISSGTLKTAAVSSARQLFAMLERGRIELAIADRLVGQAYAEQYAQAGSRILAANTAATTEIYHIAFSRKSAARHLIPAVNRAIRELQEQGAIEAMVELPGNPDE